MKDKIVLRKADVNDIDQLVDMRIEYLKEDLGEKREKEILSLKPSLKQFFGKHLNVDVEAFVAECAGKIVSSSFTVYYFRLPHPDFPQGSAGIPINGYTKPGYRKKGLAGSLLKMSAEYAKRRGVELLNMEVTKMGGSVSKEIGFTEIHYIPVQMRLK